MKIIAVTAAFALALSPALLHAQDGLSGSDERGVAQVAQNPVVQSAGVAQNNDDDDDDEATYLDLAIVGGIGVVAVVAAAIAAGSGGSTNNTR